MRQSKTYYFSKAILLNGLSLNAASQSFLLVVWPLWGRTLGFTDIQTGALLGISALMLLISAPSWGFASEKIGRRRVLLIALAGCLLTPTGFALIAGWRLNNIISAPLAFVLLLAVRVIQSVLSGGLLPASQAWFGDITAPHLRVKNMGLLGASHGLGAVAGTFLAWFYGGKIILVFYGFTILMGLAWMAVAVFFKDSLHSNRKQVSDLPVKWVDLCPFFLITVFGITVYGLCKQVTGLYLQDVLGFTPQDALAKTGQIITASSLVMVMVQSLGLRVINLPKENLIFVGGFLVLIAAVLLTLAGDWHRVLLALMIMGLAFGLMLPGNLAALSVKAGPAAQGQAAGVNALAQGLGMSLGPMLGAGLFGFNPSIPFIGAIVAGVILIILAGIIKIKFGTDQIQIISR